MIDKIYRGSENHEVKYSPEPAQGNFRRPGITQLILPYWLSHDKLKAVFLLGIVIAISFYGTYVAVSLNRVQGELTDALIALNWEKLKPLFALSMLLGTGSVLLPIISSYASGYLGLRWRTWLTHDYVNKWTSNVRYYLLERDGLISNADQRIAEDIRLMTSKTLDLFISLTSVVVSTVTYSVLLWKISGALNFTVLGRTYSMSGYMVYAAYLYSIVHLLLSHWLGKRLIGLNMHQQTVEADFRHQGMQLRENAEQIAFYRGGERECNQLLSQFARVRANTLAILTRIFCVMFGQSAYAHVFSLLPTLLALPQLLSGKITYGEMVSIIGAYGMLQGTIAFFPQAYTDFTAWLALSNRLRDFEGAINQADAHGRQISYSYRNEQLHCTKLNLRTPGGSLLTQVENWRVEKGERWLIKGRSGSGKSTLLRVCAGLWDFGEGKIDLAPEGASLFLPQKSYIPEGTLKDALCYPHDSSMFSDERCRQALHDCCLSGLMDFLAVHKRWQQTLSGGEQQRLALARVLLQRPEYIFLDEATSGLDIQTEQQIYAVLTAQLSQSALVSVAHRESLAHFHTHTLNLTP